MLNNYDTVRVDDGPDFVLSPNDLRSLLKRAREETGLKHLLTMDQLAKCRRTIFLKKSEIAYRLLRPNFPKKEDFPGDPDIDSAEESDGAFPDPDYNPGQELQHPGQRRPAVPETPAQVLSLFKHGIRFRAAIVLYTEWMQNNFTLISDREGKIIYPPGFKETIYPGI